MSIRGRIDTVCCCCLVAKLCLTVWDPVDCRMQAPLSSAISQSLLKFMSIELVMLSDHLILCHPLLFLLSVFSSIKNVYNTPICNSHKLELKCTSARELMQRLWYLHLSFMKNSRTLLQAALLNFKKSWTTEVRLGTVYIIFIFL